MKHLGTSLLVILSLALLYSCAKKTPQAPEATMSANVGGQTMSFSPSVGFNSDGMYIIGTSGQTNLQNQIQFFAINQAPNYVGSYKLKAYTGAEANINITSGSFANLKL
jgi:hypothetical protein